MFSTWSFETERPLALDTPREKLRKLPGGTVYRAKGVAYSGDGATAAGNGISALLPQRN